MRELFCRLGAALLVLLGWMLAHSASAHATAIAEEGVPDALRNQLQRRGVGKLAVDLVAPKQAGLERVFQMLLG